MTVVRRKNSGITTKELARQFHVLSAGRPDNEQHSLLCNLVEEILGETDEDDKWQATNEMYLIEYLTEQHDNRFNWTDGILVDEKGDEVYYRPDGNRRY